MGFPGGAGGKEPACQRRRPKRRAQALGREAPPEEGTVTHPSALAWRIPWTKKPGGLQSIESQIAEHDSMT